MSATIQNVMTAAKIGELMGGKVLPPIAWALIQEEALGSTREEIAQGLGVGVGELEGVRDSVTQLEGAESEALWQQGVIALRVSRMLNEGAVTGGWDAAEAMALNKLNQSLSQMTGNGDPATMLAIAVAANKAMRRRRGEGKGMGGNGMPGRPDQSTQGASLDLTLRSGELGTLQLRLSPALQQQMANRTIDVTPNRPAGGALNLEMLKLSETRELIVEKKESKSALDQRFDFSAMMGQMDGPTDD